MCAPIMFGDQPAIPSCRADLAQLGDEVKSAFIATVGSSAAKVVRGVLLTRPGFEDKAVVAANLQVRSQRYSGRSSWTGGFVLRACRLP